MELEDLRMLAGPAPGIDAEAVSVLRTGEPLVVHVAGPVAAGLGQEVAARLRTLPTVTVVCGEPATVPAVLVDAADVCLSPSAEPPRPWVHAPLDQLGPAVAAQPEAALALAVLLRAATGAGRSPWDALAAEASTYAMLLGSRPFRRWLAERGPAPSRPVGGARVALTRVGDVLRVELDRPDVHNAVDSAMRDALVEAFTLVADDPSITAVSVSGRGPSFCAGGDLSEFGTVVDPVTSFAVRLTRHPGHALQRVADRTTVRLHGACIGAGIEMAAFAGRVTADPTTTIRLPEVAMGLVPGAGGTVSIPGRIGRQRTAWLALTGQAIDARRALGWGLVDAIDEGTGDAAGGIDPHGR